MCCIFFSVQYICSLCLSLLSLSHFLIRFQCVRPLGYGVPNRALGQPFNFFSFFLLYFTVWSEILNFFVYNLFYFNPFSLFFFMYEIVSDQHYFFFGKDDGWLAGARECLLLVPHLTLGFVFILPFSFSLYSCLFECFVCFVSYLLVLSVEQLGCDDVSAFAEIMLRVVF